MQRYKIKKHYLCKNISFFTGMKRITIISLLILNGLLAFAQTQQGFVRTLGRPDKQGEALQGVTIRVKGQHNPVVSQADGTFSINMSDKKNGDPYSLQQVRKNGYELNETSVIGRQFAFSDKVPLTLVMVSTEQLQADKARIEEKAQEVASNNYEKKRALLEQQLADNAITTKQYQDAIFDLQNKFEKYQSLIDGLAEHYAHTDYDQLNEKEREISLCIEHGELDRADSLLQTLFDPIEDIRRNKEALEDLNRQIEQAQGVITQANEDMAAVLKQQEKDAEYLYQLYTIALARFDNEKASFYIETRAELDPYVGEWQHDAAHYFLNQNQFQKSEPFFARALDYYRLGDSLFPNTYGFELAQVLSDYAMLYDETQQLSESEAFYYEALDIFRRLDQEDPGVYEYYLANTLNNLGELYRRANLYASSEEKFLEAIKLYRKLAEENPAEYEGDLALAMGNLANVYSNTPFTADAEELFKSALDIYEKLNKEKPRDYDPDLARTQYNLGTLYYQEDRFPECETSFLSASEIFERLAKANPQVYEPSLALTYTGLASLYHSTERLSESSDMYYNAFDIYERLVAVDSIAYYPEVASAFLGHALLLQDEGAYSDSEDGFFDAIYLIEQLSETYPETYDPMLATIYDHLARLYYETQRLDECEKYMREALEIYWRSIENNPEVYDVDLANTLDYLDTFYKETQRQSARKALFEDALERYRHLTEKHWAFGVRVADMLTEIGIMYFRESQYPEAIASFKEALPYYQERATNSSYYLNRETVVLYYLSMIYEETNNFAECFQTNKVLIPLMRTGYESNPDSFRRDFVNTMGNQSYNALIMKDFAESEKQAKDALAIDPSQHWIVTNLAAALLFQGKYEEAEKTYLQYKEELKENFLNDFNDFEAAGIIPETHHAEVERIKQILNE